jgi:hypothetical protein
MRSQDTFGYSAFNSGFTASFASHSCDDFRHSSELRIGSLSNVVSAVVRSHAFGETDNKQM